MGLSGNTGCAADAVPGVIEKPYGLYPTITSFSADYGAEDYREWVEQSNGDPLPAPLALYMQEFSAEASARLRVAGDAPASLLPAISRELALQGALFDVDRPLQQVVLSQSMVTQWDDDSLRRLLDVVRDSFPLHHSGISNGCVCIGSAIPAADRLLLLHSLGFNSVRYELVDSAGMQGVLEELGQSIGLARQAGFRQIMLDLHCTVRSAETVPAAMQAWLDRVCPERIRYADTSTILSQSYAPILSELGYQNIGMGWYARENDPFVQARAAGLLHWFPLGYTDMPAPDVIGIGPGAVSSIGEFYGRNESGWKAYQASLNDGQLPVVCGIELEADDVLRREIMTIILATGHIRVSAIEDKWGIRFKQFFARETEQLHAFEQKGWLDWQQGTIRIRVRGCRELGRICQTFDHRLRAQLSPPSQSCS